MRQTVMQRFVQAAVGIYGKILQNRTNHLDIRKNSAVILKRQTGSQQQLQLAMKRLFLISKIYVRETQEQEKLLQAVL